MSKFKIGCTRMQAGLVEFHCFFQERKVQLLLVTMMNMTMNLRLLSNILMNSRFFVRREIVSRM